MTQYAVNNIYLSIQGEGCMTGTPMIVVRLQGCGVGCPWCDTKETWHADPLHLLPSLSECVDLQGVPSPVYTVVSGDEIADFIKFNLPGSRWVLITGGEPAEQDLADLVRALHLAGYPVALETSGTALGLIDADCDWVCVSPKLNMPSGKIIRGEALELADEIKYVVGKPDDIETLDNLLGVWESILKEGVQICLQPVSQSKKATELCVKVCQSRGWRLSLQVHKYIDLP